MIDPIAMEVLREFGPGVTTLVIVVTVIIDKMKNQKKMSEIVEHLSRVVENNTLTISRIEKFLSRHGYQM
jgi:hypothetical protein